MRTRRCQGLCPRFQAAMDVLARPWNGLLMAALEGGPARYSVLLSRLRPIGDRMLAERLRELQERGLVSRHVREGPPVAVEYALSPAGRGFRKVEAAIGAWGALLSPPRGRRPRRALATS